MARASCLLVALSRVSADFKALLSSFSVGLKDILGETGVSASIQPLCLPGGILVFVALVTVAPHHMSIAMSAFLAATVDGVYLLFTATTGALGAFIVGGDTVSNMMLSRFQRRVAEPLGDSTSLLVALQAVGAASCNMIAIHNVVAASATVGVLGREGAVPSKTITPTAYYLSHLRRD